MPSASAVHPHARGDNWIGNQLVQNALGSPPRAWGQLMRLLKGIPAYRFTPTRVGTILTKLLILRLAD